MKVSDEQIAHWKKDAVTAYHTKAFEGSFEIYWKITGVLRMDFPIPYTAYWDDSKAIKLAAWNEEAIKHGEGL